MAKTTKSTKPAETDVETLEAPAPEAVDAPTVEAVEEEIAKPEPLPELKVEEPVAKPAPAPSAKNMEVTPEMIAAVREADAKRLEAEKALSAASGVNVGSKKIYLRMRPLIGHLPKELLADARSVLGSVFKDRQPLKAFYNREDEVRYLEPLLDVDSSDREWSKHVRRFYAELRIKVTFAGVEFEVGRDTKGNPINLLDYVKAKFAENHPLVAGTEREMQEKSYMRFYIQDPTKDTQLKNSLVQVSKHADREFIKASDNEERMQNLLRVLSPNVKVESFDKNSIENMLYDIKSSQPKKFLKHALDENMDVEAEILKFIEFGVLTRVGSAIYYYDEPIGENINDAILYLKNPRRSTALNAMRLRYKEIKN